MDQAQIREAMRAITTGVGRRKAGGGVRGVQVEKLRARLTEALTAGERTTGQGAGRPYNAATTAKMAARLMGVGGAVPECVAERYAFGACLPGLRAMAVGMGVDADGLIAALVRPADLVSAVQAEAVVAETAAALAAMDLDAGPAPIVEEAVPEVPEVPEGGEVVHLVQPVVAVPRRTGGRRR